MSVQPDGRQWLLGRLLWLQRRGSQYRLWVWASDGRDDQDGAAAGSFLPVGGSGGGGEPLVLGDSDPPDFLVTEDGDIIMVEDDRG